MRGHRGRHHLAGSLAAFAAAALRWAIPAAFFAACSATGGGDRPEPATTTGAGAQGGAGPASGGGGGGFNFGGSGGGPILCTPGGGGDDVDGDGFTPDEGDCNDCDANRNPNAIEVPTPPGADAYDEDCDGETDEDDSALCDAGLLLDEADPLVAAQALELCKVSTGPRDHGVVSAVWTLSNGAPPPQQEPQRSNFHLGHGILGTFGPSVSPRRGERMLALSSGTARQPTDPGFFDGTDFDKGYASVHPQGFPKESPACPGTFTGQPHDAAGLTVTLRAPSNAHGFSFDFDFYTYEWPFYVCTTWNDFFVAILSPIPSGQADGNVSFDSQGNPVSVNNAFLEVCGCPGNPPDPCVAGNKIFTCPRGTAELIGTGFGADTGFQDHGATSWLRTSAPIAPGSEITIRFVIYDSGDGLLDSTTLVDNWQWIADPGVTVETNPVPE